MYGSELPTPLSEQLQKKISDRTFLTIKEAHHLLQERKKVSPVIAY
jgi:hypothetical protein